MRKLIFLGIFLLFAFINASAEEYCRVGGDSVEKFKPLTERESLYILPEDTLVDIKGKTKNYHCVLEKGTVLVVKDGVAVRAYQCGNELITRLVVGESKPESKTEVKPEPEPEPESNPQVNNYYTITPQQTLVPYYYGYGYNYFPVYLRYGGYSYYNYSYRYPYHRDYRDRRNYRNYRPRQHSNRHYRPVHRPARPDTHPPAPPIP